MRPSDIKKKPYASQCGSFEGEQVAMNIMKILAATSNSFHKITWPEYIHQRLFDGATAEDLDEEKPYFDRVIQYFENEATVRLFSEEWNLPIPEYEKSTVSDQGKEIYNKEFFGHPSRESEAKTEEAIQLLASQIDKLWIKTRG